MHATTVHRREGRDSGTTQHAPTHGQSGNSSQYGGVVGSQKEVDVGWRTVLCGVSPTNPLPKKMAI